MRVNFLKYNIATILVLFAGISCFGQNLRNDIAKINANYNADKSFKLNMVVSLSKNGDQVESNSYSYLQNKNHSLFKMSKVSTLVLDDFLIIIDDRTQNIIVSPSSGNKPFKVSGSYDSLLDIAKSSKFEVLDSGKKNKYTLFFKKLEYKKIEIIFNPSNFQLNLVKLYYSDKKKKKEVTKVLQFTYDETQALTDKEKIKLDKGTYLIQVGNKINLAPTYKNYDLIDYRSFYQE